MAKPLKSLAKSKATNDLFGVSEPKGRALKVASRGSSAEAGYTARDIEVLEGLEPVRRRRVRDRARRRAGGRRRAPKKTLLEGVGAGPSQRQARGPRQDQQPPRHQNPLPARRRDFRRQGRLQAAAPVQDGPFQGLFVR